jgi:hypothetical protein
MPPNLEHGVTDKHPIYSVDRRAFVAAGELRSGERVQRALGQPARVAGTSRRPGIHTVYTFEVDVEHAYHVSPPGILVHNGPASEPPIGPNYFPEVPGSGPTVSPPVIPRPGLSPQSALDVQNAQAIQQQLNAVNQALQTATNADEIAQLRMQQFILQNMIQNIFH